LLAQEALQREFNLTFLRYQKGNYHFNEIGYKHHARFEYGGSAQMHVLKIKKRLGREQDSGHMGIIYRFSLVEVITFGAFFGGGSPAPEEIASRKT